MNFTATRVMSGTFGEVWLNGIYVAEIKAFQAKDAFNREDIKQAGKLRAGKKLMSLEGTGSMTMHKVNSRMALLISDEIRQGRDPRFTVISKLDDPDAFGAERVSFTGVAFDDLTIADWELGAVGQIETPFSFEDYEYLDLVVEV